MKKQCIIAVFVTALVFGTGYIGNSAYKIGNSGEIVKLIQRKLVKQGIKIEIDGKYGKDTENAVRIFQKRKKLKVDGIIGEETYFALVGKYIPNKKNIKNKRKNKNVFHNTENIYGIDDHIVRWKEAGVLKGKVKNITEEAKRYIGVPYRFGGITPEGFDCSGFIQYVFNRQGIDLPRSADEQFERGNKININSLRPGDLVFFNTYDEGVSHSGIYIGSGDFISATTSQGIAIATMKNGYWHDRYIGASRVL